MATRSASDSASAPLAASRSRGRSLAAMSLMRGLVVMTGGSFSTNCFRQRDKNVVQRSHPPKCPPQTIPRCNAPRSGENGSDRIDRDKQPKRPNTDRWRSGLTASAVNRCRSSRAFAKLLLPLSRNRRQNLLPGRALWQHRSRDRTLSRNRRQNLLPRSICKSLSSSRPILRFRLVNRLPWDSETPISNFETAGYLRIGFHEMELVISRKTIMRFARSYRSGFTLVEIMIVVAIIGLLAAIVIPNSVRARATAQQKVSIHNLRQIDSAKQQWALESRAPGGIVPLETDIGPYLNRTGSTTK